MKTKSYRYEVALSFAGEQRYYVERVANRLKKLGVSYFYDFDEQIELWGKNLTQHLDEIYYEKSQYFIPFISKEYKEKNWTKLEVNSALDRNMEELKSDFQQYILPVKFDDIRIPGIVGSIGYIDARKKSPEELADLIFMKVRGYLPEDYDTKKTTEPLLSQIPDFHNNINAKRYETLCGCFENTRGIYAAVIYGEKGLGKKTCIERFLSDKEHVIRIKSSYQNQFQLEPIVYALNLGSKIKTGDSDLAFKEQIKKNFLAFCQHGVHIIYIENLNEFDIDTVQFLLEVTHTLLTRYVNSKTFLIYEFDTDENANIIDDFYRLPPEYIELMLFERISKEELKKLFFQTVGNVAISEENINYILDSAFGNIMYLNVIINYLKGKGFIHHTENGLVCNTLPNGILSNILRDFILQRYERLDDDLKEILAKSTIVGKFFQSDMLSKPFKIINADELLKKIEEISKLITQPYNGTYTFENLDVYHLVRDKISPQMQVEWHQILAAYYERQLKRKRQRKYKIAIIDEIESLYPIAKHLKYAQNYDTAITYYLDLIIKYEQITDYHHELEMIKDIRYMLDFVDVDKFNLDSLEYNILKSEAHCHKELGNYDNAYALYEEAKDFLENAEFSEELFEILHLQSYCLYMSGDVEGTLNILNSLLEQVSQSFVNRNLYIKTIALLSSVYDVTGNKNLQKQFFIEALDYYRENNLEQDYYILLRTASMIFGEELAIDMYESAEKYFRRQNSTRYLAEVLHNKATDQLYLGRITQVEKPLEESIQLFDSYGSKLVHYPLNSKGILKMVSEGDFNAAINIFESALQYKSEIFSEVTLRINILNCLNKLGEHEKAYEQLEIIDNLISKPESKSTLVYTIYHCLNWAFYFFNLHEYMKCLEKIDECAHLQYMEPRYRFVYKFLRYQVKKILGYNAHNTAGTAPNGLFEMCVKNGFYFVTVRFYE